MTTLADVMWIVGISAVSETQIEVAIPPEDDRAPVVIPIRLRHFQQDAFSRQIRLIRIRFGNVNLAQDAAFGSLLAVIQIKQSVVLKFWVKSQSQKSFFVLDMRLSRR